MRRWAIILLTLATAFIHLAIYFSDPPNYTLFLLNGLGYLGLLGLLYLPLPLPAALRRLVRPVFIGYTLLTIVMYVVMSARFGNWTVPLGPIDKVVEIALVFLLWQEDRN